MVVLRKVCLTKGSHGIRAQKSRKSSPVLTAIACLCAAVFVISTFLFIKACSQTGQEQQAFEVLKDSVQVSESSKDCIQEDGDDEIDSVYQALYKQNSDFIAWICVPGTSIDYPVMSTPDDPDYYLYRAFNKEESQSGTPFVGKGCNLDSTALIIYGHNMVSGTMFGTLDRYDNIVFWSQHKRLTLTADEGQIKYEVFAAVRTQANSQEANSNCIPFSMTGDLSKDNYNSLVTWLKDNSLFDTGLTPSYAEQILLLATCSYHTDDGRFVLAARRVS